MYGVKLGKIYYKQCIFDHQHCITAIYVPVVELVKDGWSTEVIVLYNYIDGRCKFTSQRYFFSSSWFISEGMKELGDNSICDMLYNHALCKLN